MSPRTAPVTLKILNASEAEGLVIYGAFVRRWAVRVALLVCEGTL
jgi:hypothetical protein